MSAKKMNAEVFESICTELETTHKGINTLATERNSSKRSFYDFKDGKNEEVRAKNLEQYEARDVRYTRARAKQLDYLEELLRELTFNDSRDSEVHKTGTNIGGNRIQRHRLQVDTLKFILGKLRSHKWGDKLDVTSKGEKIEGVNVTIVRPGESTE